MCAQCSNNLFNYFLFLNICKAGMAVEVAKDNGGQTVKTDRVPCGCVHQNKGWLLTRVNECENHRRKRTAKRPYRPEAECVKP